MTVTRSRCPRAFARRTEKPFSALWKVTRSTSPASTSRVDGSGCGFMRICRPPYRRCVAPGKGLRHITQMDTEFTPTYQNVVGYFARTIMRDLRLVGGQDILFGKL